MFDLNWSFGQPTIPLEAHIRPRGFLKKHDASISEPCTRDQYVAESLNVAAT